MTSRAYTFFFSQTVASGQDVDVRRQLRARGVAQRLGHAPRAHRGRVAPRAVRGRAAPPATHLSTRVPGDCPHRQFVINLAIYCYMILLNTTNPIRIHS